MQHVQVPVYLSEGTSCAKTKFHVLSFRRRMHPRMHYHWNLGVAHALFKFNSEGSILVAMGWHEHWHWHWHWHWHLHLHLHWHWHWHWHWQSIVCISRVVRIVWYFRQWLDIPRIYLLVAGLCFLRARGGVALVYFVLLPTSDLSIHYSTRSLLLLCLLCLNVLQHHITTRPATTTNASFEPTSPHQPTMTSSMLLLHLHLPLPLPRQTQTQAQLQPRRRFACTLKALVRGRWWCEGLWWTNVGQSES